MHHEITNYMVTIYSRARANSHVATISLKTRENRYVGSIHFWAEDSALPAARTADYIHMHFHIDLLDSVIDLLCKESPIYLITSHDTAHLKTRDEAVGEEDRF